MLPEIEVSVGEATVLVNNRVVLLLGTELARPEELSILVETRTELEIVGLEALELDDPLDELAAELDDAEPNEGASDVPNDDGIVEDELDVAVRFTKRLEEINDDVVALASDEDTVKPVVRLARRLDAEADDGLGDSVDTPTLSALMMSAACPAYQPTYRCIHFNDQPSQRRRRLRLGDVPLVS